MPKTIPFVRGFRRPQQKDIDRALGDDASFSNEFKTSFDSLPKPTNDLDWLANNRERGQTYKQFLKECPFIGNSNSTEKYIYLTLFDDLDRLSALNIDHLVEYTKRFYQIEVKLCSLFTNIHWNEAKRSWMCTVKGKNDSTTTVALKTRYNSASGHSQIFVFSILNLLRRSVPKDARCLVALTSHDLYSEESDLFIAGLAHGNANIAVFSFFRYDPRLMISEELWYDWKLRKTKCKRMMKILLLRSCRLLTHEIGHLLGLDHCIYYSCLMNGSGHLEEDFSQPLFLCPIDLRKLSQLAEIDIIQRYEQLLDFCIENQFTEEIHILKHRLYIFKQNTPMTSSKRSRNNDRDELKRIPKRLKMNSD